MSSMCRTDPEFEVWVERARAVTVAVAAEKVGFVPTKATGKLRDRAGACPRCGGTDRFSIQVTKNWWNCRGCGRGGKDGISLVMWFLDVGFIEACEAVEGPRPNPPADETLAERIERQRRQQARLDELRAERDRRQIEAERETNEWRERERLRAYGWWKRGWRLQGSAAARYLAGRSIDLPPNLRLRWHPAWTLYDGEDDEKQPRVVHRGPALFAPIVERVGAGEHFLGLHVTWFDPEHPGRKILVRDAEGELVPAKKVRGAKSGGHIALVGDGAAATRLFLGEGIETVLSVWTALSRCRSRLLEDAAFWTSVDLGNFAGKALDRLPHPSEVKLDSAGRRRRVKVPGIVPDPASRAVVIPDGVTDLHLIGDGDSEPFRTRCALARAAQRHAADGRTVRLVMAPAGADFNDVLRAGHG